MVKKKKQEQLAERTYSFAEALELMDDKIEMAPLYSDEHDEASSPYLKWRCLEFSTLEGLKWVKLAKAKKPEAEPWRYGQVPMVARYCPNGDLEGLREPTQYCLSSVTTEGLYLSGDPGMRFVEWAMLAQDWSFSVLTDGAWYPCTQAGLTRCFDPGREDAFYKGVKQNP